MPRTGGAQGARKRERKMAKKREAWAAWRSGSDRRMAAAYYRSCRSSPRWRKTPGLAEAAGARQTADDIYQYLDPIARWLLQGHPLFTDMSAWNKVVAPDKDAHKDYRRGLITIPGSVGPMRCARSGGSR